MVNFQWKKSFNDSQIAIFTSNILQSEECSAKLLRWIFLSLHHCCWLGCWNSPPPAANTNYTYISILQYKNNITHNSSLIKLLSRPIAKIGHLTPPQKINHCPLKAEPWRVWPVVGGDKLDYASDSVSPTTTLLETKNFL